jgi:phosphoribosylaminoimidazole carboxylase
VNVQPPSSVFKTIQDKLVQKDHFAKAGVALPRYMDTPNVEAVKRAAEEFGLPLMLKSRKEGYDGRGNCVLKSISDAQKAFDTVNNPGGVYAEGWVDFVDELAVMVVRSTTGESKVRMGLKRNAVQLMLTALPPPSSSSSLFPPQCYPTVSAIQRDSVCRVVVAPARAPESSRLLAQLTAKSAIDSMPGATGVFGVELFICRDGSVLLNEVAPRPHNTGHYTQDACACSQFENHLRAVSGMELGGTDLIVGAAGMVNVLGTGDMEGTTAALKLAMSMERAAVHWYGKAPAKMGRKMGHINITADSPAEMEKDLKALMDAVGLTMEGEGKGGDVFPPPPLVGVIMGSDSDLPCMSAACTILKEFGVHFEVDIVSAHRTPEKMTEYAKEAAGRGVEVIIAGAGGAAHLPGMVASMVSTTTPQR